MKLPCVIGQYCDRHNFVHGAEAEELRRGLEKVVEVAGVGGSWARKILDEVDARDSLSYLEQADEQ